MFTARCPLILASASPRRHAYLAQLGLKFSSMPADIEEIAEPEELPRHFAQRMAAAKARSIAAASPAACVIGADTVVAIDRRIFGKPADRDDALAMLTGLQGRTHEVTTGYAVIAKERNVDEIGAVTTQVTFGTFTEQTLRRYVESGEPMDKAGAYGIQGIGEFLVRSISGSYSNVVGLPVHAVVRILLDHALIQVDTVVIPR